MLRSPRVREKKWSARATSDLPEPVGVERIDVRAGRELEDRLLLRRVEREPFRGYIGEERGEERVGVPRAGREVPQEGRLGSLGGHHRRAAYARPRRRMTAPPGVRWRRSPGRSAGLLAPFPGGEDAAPRSPGPPRASRDGGASRGPSRRASRPEESPARIPSSRKLGSVMMFASGPSVSSSATSSGAARRGAGGVVARPRDGGVFGAGDFFARGTGDRGARDGRALATGDGATVLRSSSGPRIFDAGSQRLEDDVPGEITGELRERTLERQESVSHWGGEPF